MARTILTALTASACLACIAGAKTITVDNNPASVAMYTSLQPALDAAETGDTILIAGSPTVYSASGGPVYVRKRLNFVGPGYFLTDHNVPGINKNTAKIDSISLVKRDLHNASGSTFSGLSLKLTFGDPDITGISYDRCIGNVSLWWNSTWNYYSGTVSITRSWLDGTLHLGTWGSSARNCVLTHGMSLRDGASVSNCVVRQFDNINYIETTAGSSVSNTIFITSTSVTLGKADFASRCKGSISHCLAVSGPGPAGGASYLPDGLGNASTIRLFQEVFSGGVQDKAYVLAENSPAKGTGSDGTDLGVFTGPLPYRIGGLPAVPRITRMVIPAKATSTSGLRIELDAEAF